jgi:hypothetical protein
MTPKEKAIELINKMYKVHSNSASEITFYFSKQCALIAVDEILKSSYKNTLSDLGYRFTINGLDKYWQEVKKEIELL